MEWRKTWYASLLLALWLGGSGLQAGEQDPWGLQVGLTTPVGSDLTTTTKKGLNPTLGVHSDWSWTAGQTLRARLELAWVQQGRQTSSNAILAQEMLTKVSSIALGADYLFQVPRANRWALGGGLSLIRWSVDSTNRLQQNNGLFVPSGNSSWTRMGQNLVVSYRQSRHVEAELRFIASHYGYENQPTRTVSCNVLWHF